MMTPLSLSLLPRYILLIFAAALPITASTIDFEAEAANRGGNLTGTPDSPLVIGPATFSGGELLNAEIGLGADATGVYASQGLFGSGETNPLTITFSAPVSGFSIFVLNGDDTRSYTVSDNEGEAITKSLSSAGALGAATFSLSGSDITAVTITSANADAWDFAVDNLSFTPAVAAPEPASLVLSALALALLICLRSRRRQLTTARSARRS
jgi:hypothetical protein